MKRRAPDRQRPWLSIPPWIILGAAVIMAAIVVAMAIRNTNREKALASQTLLEKGAAILRAFESAARTGMNMRWGGTQLQVLLQETASQPGIFYLAVTDEDGTILAHSDSARIGERLHDAEETKSLEAGLKEKWRTKEEGGKQRVFEVYRYFAPMAGRDGPGHPGEPHWQQWCQWGSGNVSLGSGRQIIFAGFDVAPFEEALEEDFRNTAILSGVLLLLGVGGVMMLFGAQSYRMSRRQLQNTQAFASEIINNLPVGLITTGSDGRVSVVNSAAESISGLKASQVAGRLPDEVLPTSLCSLKGVIDRGEPVIEHETECAFGEKSTPLSVSAAKIANDQGDFLGNIFIFRDLGEVRKLQEEVRRKEKLAALGSLAAGIAHEIRNPLSSIKGFAKYFESHSVQGSEGRELAAVMTKEVDRLNRVITELLEFARPSDLKTQPMNVNDLIMHTLRLVRQDAESKKVKIEFSRDEELPEIDIDPDRFTQALLNLYLNAVQAMDAGGVLSIGARTDAHGGVRIEVMDTGKGIPPESLGSIFNPYFTTKASGTGLGLAIVHKVVEAHHGDIKVRSALGRGTVFSIFLPTKLRREGTYGRQA
ncbi:ATP-binding protein [Nitratidesulfovibrio liaohensis]|uniref:Sensor histidine kinase ZraS n=1 Tax=Nitratidesulfovibrio liaohensis TaxID=2604158 RepID=A0ABY9R3Z6_9BACT|nr:ATP-binding protein [Nitratidesulfovibrio liaohensis]WMW66332.1 ATP-binding protein [Nitratidesulfovibrio liaohensis]